MSNSDSPIRIVLWRHGQTDWNVENRFQGHSDIALNKVGEYQVSEAAKVLAALRPDRIISSDLISTDAILEIYTSLGQLVYTSNLPMDKNVDVSQLSSGLYFVKVSEMVKSFTQKMIKN